MYSTHAIDLSWTFVLPHRSRAELRTHGAVAGRRQARRALEGPGEMTLICEASAKRDTTEWYLGAFE